MKLFVFHLFRQKYLRDVYVANSIETVLHVIYADIFTVLKFVFFSISFPDKYIDALFCS